MIFLSSVILSLAFSDFVTKLGSDFERLFFMFLVVIAVGIFMVIGFRVSFIFSELKDDFEGMIKTISFLKSFIVGVLILFFWLLFLVFINNLMNLGLNCLQIIFLIGTFVIWFLISIFIYKKTSEKLKEKYGYKTKSHIKYWKDRIIQF